MARIVQVRRVWVCDKLKMNGWYIDAEVCAPLARVIQTLPDRLYISIYEQLTGICSLSLLYNKKIWEHISQFLSL